MDWLTGVLILICGVLGVFLYSLRARVIPGIPKPDGFIPWFGHTFVVVKNQDNIPEFTANLCHTINRTWQFCIPGQSPMVFVFTPENVEYILKTNFDNFPKGYQMTNKFFDFMGRGIFNVDGDAWRVQRKTASHIFTMRALQGTMTDVFLHHAHLVIKKLDSLKPNEPIDMFDLFNRYTLDSFAQIAFGVELHCLEFGEVPFLRSFDLTQHVIDRRFQTPFWKITRFLKIGEEGKLAKAIQVVKSTVDRIIDEHHQLSESQLQKNTDLLSMFISLKGDEDGNPFTKDYLRDIMMNFIIAGRDTTAQCLSWMFWNISQRPDVEQKLVQEIDTVLQGGDPSYSLVTQMNYAHAVMSETLRLHPSVPRELKHAQHDCTLPDGTFIPAGTAVLPAFQVMGQREEIWGPTAKTWDPQKWLDFENEPSPYRFVAFQAGPRTCLGKHMAYLEAKLVMSMMLQKFHFTLVPGQKIEAASSLSLPMKYPLMMTVTRR